MWNFRSFRAVCTKLQAITETNKHSGEHWAGTSATMTALSQKPKSTVGQDPALPDCVNKEGICSEGSIKSFIINPRLFQLNHVQMLLLWKAALCHSRSGCKMLLSLCPNTYRIVPLPSQWVHLFPNTDRDQWGRREQDLCACVCTMHICGPSLQPLHTCMHACRFVDN